MGKMWHACRMLKNNVLGNAVLEKLEKDGMKALIFILRNEVAKGEDRWNLLRIMSNGRLWY
jgi:hypothetical protein